MKRRDFIWRALWAAGGAMALPVAARQVAPRGQAGRGPLNVLFIMVDDLRPQLGCYGHAQMSSPHIDALADEGMLFERAYCQQALCAPSRVSMLSGARPDTTEVYRIGSLLSETRPDLVTLPQHFRTHGYRTISIGKVYHHDTDDLTGWERGPLQPRGNPHWRDYATEAAQALNDTEGVGPAFEAADVDDEGYQDGLVAAKALQEMVLEPERPFFMAVGFRKPHLPFNAPKQYWDRYDRAAISIADNPFQPAGAPGISMTDWSELRGYHGIPTEGTVSDDLARELIHGYYACVSYVDAQVGRLMAGLRDNGLLENTVVVLLGDHGYQLGEHSLWTKHTNFEVAVHSPLMLRVPTAAPAPAVRGARTDALVEFVDLYPTLCQLCELPLPAHLEGDALGPLLDETVVPGAADAWKTAAFSQYPRFHVNGEEVTIRAMGYSIRTDQYRFTLWRDMIDFFDAGRELYDHVNDPNENTNVAFLPDNAALVDELRARLCDHFPSLQANVVKAHTETPPRTGEVETSLFPTPFRVRTQLRMVVRRSQMVTVQAFDVQGRPVALLHEGRLDAGREYWFDFERGTLPSGTYFLRAQGTYFELTKQVVLLR